MLEIHYSIRPGEVITVPMDSTLTVSGAAADAKVVGDSISAIDGLIRSDENPIPQGKTIQQEIDETNDSVESLGNSLTDRITSNESSISTNASGIASNATAITTVNERIDEIVDGIGIVDEGNTISGMINDLSNKIGDIAEDSTVADDIAALKEDILNSVENTIDFEKFSDAFTAILEDSKIKFFNVIASANDVNAPVAEANTYSCMVFGSSEEIRTVIAVCERNDEIYYRSNSTDSVDWKPWKNFALNSRVSDIENRIINVENKVNNIVQSGSVVPALNSNGQFTIQFPKAMSAYPKSVVCTSQNAVLITLDAGSITGSKFTGKAYNFSRDNGMQVVTNPYWVNWVATWD